MDTDARKNAIELTKRFVSGADTSIELANAIEVILDDNFPDNDFVKETVAMLAMYRPEGGFYLFQTLSIQQRLEQTLPILLEQWSAPK